MLMLAHNKAFDIPTSKDSWQRSHELIKAPPAVFAIKTHQHTPIMIDSDHQIYEEAPSLPNCRICLVVALMLRGIDNGIFKAIAHFIKSSVLA